MFRCISFNGCSKETSLQVSWPVCWWLSGAIIVRTTFKVRSCLFSIEI